jgi:uncharacterized protein (TIGR02145 family)
MANRAGRESGNENDEIYSYQELETVLLVIAIDKYSDKKFGNLLNCVSDAKAFEEVLKSNHRLDQVIKLQDEKATRKNIFKSFKQLISSFKEEKKNLIILFTGHGWKSNLLNHFYWVPHDGIKNQEHSLISNNEIVTFLKVIDSLHSFLIVDSCFSGEFVYDVPEGKLNEETSGNSGSRWVLSSGRFKVSDGERGGNSPFMSLAIEFLKNSTKNADIINLFNYINNISTQKPDLKAIRIEGHGKGLFAFGQGSHKIGSWRDPVDNQEYKTIRINNMIWLADNFRRDHQDSWTVVNKSDSNKIFKLYTYKQAHEMTPEGWRLPSRRDFEELAQHMGGYKELQVKRGESNWKYNKRSEIQKGFLTAVKLKFAVNFLGFVDSTAHYSKEIEENYEEYLTEYEREIYYWSSTLYEPDIPKNKKLPKEIDEISGFYKLEPDSTSDDMKKYLQEDDEKKENHEAEEESQLRMEQSNKKAYVFVVSKSKEENKINIENKLSGLFVRYVKPDY